MTMVVRVLCARPLDPDQTFPGFAMYGSHTSHPFALVVDELVKP